MRAWACALLVAFVLVACSQEPAAPPAEASRFAGKWVLDTDCSREQMMAMTRRSLEKLVEDASPDERAEKRAMVDDMLAAMEEDDEEDYGEDDGAPEGDEANAHLTLRPDGTCTHHLGEEVLEVTWTAEGDVVTVDRSEPERWRLDGEHLLHLPEEIFCLHREK